MNDTTEEQQADDDYARVKRACQVLIEHFDAVQIFATRHVGGETGTLGIHRGEGNWYARFGQVKDWCIKQDEGSRLDRRGEDQ